MDAEVMDYEIVGVDEPGPEPVGGACPVRVPDGIVMPHDTAEAWRSDVARFGDSLYLGASGLRTFNDLRELADRCEAFARRLRRSADIIEPLDREHATRLVESRAQWRRMARVDVVRVGA